MYLFKKDLKVVAKSPNWYVQWVSADEVRFGNGNARLCANFPANGGGGVDRQALGATVRRQESPMSRVGVIVELLLGSLMLVSTTLGVAASSVPWGTIERDGRSGTVRLVAHGPAVKFEIDGLCRYDPQSNRWSRERFGPISKYWVQWKENGRPFASLAVSGPVLCNDIHLAPTSRTDVIAACIPLRQSAQAAYVPDPKIDCAP